MSVRQAFDEMKYGPAPETDAEARQWLESHERRFGHMIDGNWLHGRRGFDAISPATGEKLARLSKGSAKEVDAAVAAANSAQEQWAGLTGHQRARYLYALARAVQKTRDSLPLLNPSIMANPFGSPVISIYRWSLATSTTMPAMPRSGIRSILTIDPWV